MDKFQLLRYYGEYLDSEDFNIEEHRKYIGEKIHTAEELCYLYERFCAISEDELYQYGRLLKEWLLSVVFVPHRVNTNINYEVEYGILL